MKLYVIANKSFDIFYQPEISYKDGLVSEIPYIFGKEPYYIGDNLYEDAWLDSSLRYAQEEFSEVEWEIFEVKVEQFA